jgi:hypothetical protein
LILTIREGAALVIQLVIQTALLEQFQLYASEAHGVRAQSARETEDEIEAKEEEGEGRQGKEWETPLTLGPSVKVLSLLGSIKHKVSKKNVYV